ncbi:hypothetical protein WDZ92_03135, partial [Nostoc sp. NIES-2111]
LYTKGDWPTYKKVLSHDELFVQHFNFSKFIDALAGYHPQPFDPLPQFVGTGCWGARMVSEIMAHSDYSWLAKYFDDLITEIIGFGWNQSIQSNRSVLIHSSMIACKLFDYQFRHWDTMSILLGSSHPSVRVCAAKLLLRDWNVIGVMPTNYEVTLQNIRVSLSSTQEALLILVSEFGNCIQKIDTHHGFRLNSTDLNQSDPKYSHILEHISSFNSELIRANLKEIIRFGSGQYHVIRSQGVYHRLLKPLIDANLLTPEDVFEVFEQLIELAFTTSDTNSSSNLHSNNPYLKALCLTYVESLNKCDKVKQDLAISKLLKNAEKWFYIVRKPLFYVRYTSESTDFALKLYWMIYLMCLIKESLSEDQTVFITKLFADHTLSVKLVLDYLIEHGMVDSDECLIVLNDTA